METRTESLPSKSQLTPKEKRWNFLTQALVFAQNSAKSGYMTDQRFIDRVREEARRNLSGFSYEDLRCIGSARKEQLQRLTPDPVVFNFFYEQVKEARREKARMGYQAAKGYVESFGANMYADPQKLLDKNGRSLWGAALLARKASLVRKMRGDQVIEGERQPTYVEILERHLMAVQEENERLGRKIKAIISKKAPEKLGLWQRIIKTFSSSEAPFKKIRRRLAYTTVVGLMALGLSLGFYEKIKAPPPVKAFSDPTAVNNLSELELKDLDIGGQAMPTATATKELTREPTKTFTPQPPPAENIKPEESMVSINNEIYQKIYSAVQEKRSRRAESDSDYLRRVNPELNQDRLSFLLVGMDARPGQKISRADAPVIASLDLKNNKLSIIRIPRDLHAPLKRVLEKNKTYAKYANKAFRINAATVFGDSDDMRRTAEEATGLSMDFCFFWDFEGFQRLIDSVDGITVEVGKAIHEESYPDGRGGLIVLDIPTGAQAMDGKTALRYARTRHADTDLLRGRRQTQITEAFAQKLTERIINNPVSALNFISKLEELRRDGHVSVCGEFSILDLLKLAQNLISEELKDFLRPTIRPVDFWKGVISGQRLEADKYQLWVGDPKATGEPSPDPDDPLVYWAKVRAKIAEIF